MLPEKRRTTLARELGAGRGLESLAGFALLACSAQCMPLPPLSMLAESPGGKPRWPHGPDFSIAHAAGRVICAIAPAGFQVGVDLESADAADAKSLRLVMSAGECRQVADGMLSATALWTSKEAVLKAAGASVLAARQVEIDGALGHYAGREYHLNRLKIDRNLVLTMATSAPVSEWRVVQVSALKLCAAPSLDVQWSRA